MSLPHSSAKPAIARLYEAAHGEVAEQITVSSEDLRSLLAAAAHTQNNDAQIAILNAGTADSTVIWPPIP